MSIDPTTGIGGSYFQPPVQPGSTGQTPDASSSSQLGGDQQSSNRSDNPLYSLESSLLQIVNKQGGLGTAQEPSIDLGPILQLLEQSTGGKASDNALNSDLQNFLHSEESKSQHTSGGLSSDQFDSDLKSFLQSEDKKYDSGSGSGSGGSSGSY